MKEVGPPSFSFFLSWVYYFARGGVMKENVMICVIQKDMHGSFYRLQRKNR